MSECGVSECDFETTTMRTCGAIKIKGILTYSDYFPIQQDEVGLCNNDGVCSL